MENSCRPFDAINEAEVIVVPDWKLNIPPKKISPVIVTLPLVVKSPAKLLSEIKILPDTDTFSARTFLISLLETEKSSPAEFVPAMIVSLPSV